ncbi:hypothetical protein BC826DRAFT_1185304 [Russula brevipes]|nr:hypothetical protein BC826DRAFT_1185304 [Russula brevipes]
MFGESESESPRVPSPWDLVLASVSIDKSYYRQDELTLSKLAAEVEEGNVEYKLHLINPSSARFARLVTQMKWRLLEGGGQAIYELGVADSGALVGLAPDDLRATLGTLHAMAAEIGARVVIAKEIEVTVADVSEVGFRTQADKRHGSRDSRRTAIKDRPKAQAFPIGAESLSDSSTSTSTPSSLNSTASLVTDSCSLASDSHPCSPSLPTSSLDIPASNHKIAHDDDSLLVFPYSPAVHLDALRPPTALSVAGNHLLYGDVSPEPVAVIVTAEGALPNPDEVLLAALGKLEVVDGPSDPEEHKRTIVEALIVRELDYEEGFLDFSSFGD